MTDWRAVMRDGDAEMSSDRSREMRRTVIATARRTASTAVSWPWRLVAAAAMLTVLAGGAGDFARRVAVEPGAAATDGWDGRRQVQFATPGGTRIIWELNPAFTLMETLP